jgi:hypothetical protein
VLLTSISVVVVYSKVFFLAPTRFGALLMLANVLYETLYKKFGWHRWPVDFFTVIILGACWCLFSGGWAAAVFVSAYCLAWGYALQSNSRILRCDPGIQDQLYWRYGAGIPLPLPHPRLIIYLRGPVLERGKIYDLGDWPHGHSARFEVVVLNPTILRPQFPLIIRLACDSDKVTLVEEFDNLVDAPEPGEMFEAKFTLEANALSEAPIQLRLLIKMGSHEMSEVIRIRSIFSPTDAVITRATVNRWKGGAKAAFGWRGDMDLHDPMTFQSVEGLRHTLELCRRYRVASTMYLSGRLTLVKEEHEKFCNHLGVNRDTPGIDDFIRFMREEVTMAGAIDFPYKTEKRYAIEIGNHMYLHYGTHAAVDEGNRWKMNAWPGDGRYPWQSKEHGSFAEQRDNAVRNNEVIREKLGVQPLSWGVPGRVYDKETARAVEAAGIEVGSDTNASAFTNVMQMPPPHHPKGTERLVELTKKYPGDPDNAYKVAMLKYWIGLARRRRRAFIFMAHHHLLRYEGVAATHCAEEVLRHVIADCKGDFYISTLLGVGRYWERVLCPKHRWVSVGTLDRMKIELHNKGEEQLEDIPVEVTINNRRQMLLLVSLPPKSNVSLSLTE